MRTAKEAGAAMILRALWLVGGCVLLYSILPAAAAGQDSLSAAAGLQGYPDSVFIVGEIVITGNTETKAFVILREMTLHPGSPITRQAIEYDENRIYSLGLFNQVQIRVMP